MAKPPIAEKIRKELTTHGHTRVDNYYWLNERENPKVIDYLRAENDYKNATMKHADSLRDKIYNEIVGRAKRADMSVPYKLEDYCYYMRFEKGKEYPICCRRKGSMDGKEEILLNINEMAEGYNYYHVAGGLLGLSVSPNNNIIAFGVDTVGRYRYTIYFKNLRTGETLNDKILNTTGGAVWANDNKTVFYCVKDEAEALRPFKILKHDLGSDVSKDKEVFHEKDAKYETQVYKSKSKKYIFICSSSTLSTEYRFLDADQPGGKFKIIQPREKDVLYWVAHYKDKFYIRTNYEAKNYRLMETSINKTSKDNWKELIPHREDVLLQGFEIFRSFLVVNERKNGLTQLRIIRWEDKAEHYLDFRGETYVAYTFYNPELYDPDLLPYISYNPEFDTDVLRFEYQSLTTPNSVFDYNMKIRKKKLLKQQEVIGDFDPENYKAERLYATAKDGTKIPISLVYRKGMEKRGDNPLLLYGYGSYGASTEPGFSSVRLSLLDRGFIYAIAHIRGGQEMGRYWYEDGKLLKKKNTFTDLIACAEHLIAERFTCPEKLFAMGGSAGGLLMGAVANMRPDLFKGIIARVPFVDVITTMLDDSIPLTTLEYDEWGNPNNKEYYDYMLCYSPYDNVEAKDYPAILVTAGLHDSQVQYWEPAKWVAKLRELKTDNNILLLHTIMEAGHSGVSGRFRGHKETALIYAFMLDLLGIDE